jgi:hypothetical protein
MKKRASNILPAVAALTPAKPRRGKRWAENPTGAPIVKSITYAPIGEAQAQAAADVYAILFAPRQPAHAQN